MSSSQQKFAQLFEHARSITPFLDGNLETDEIAELRLTIDSSESIHQLYQELAENNPEAGQAYWLTRTWDLLCWQPVFLSFIAIYMQKSLPQMKAITQYKGNCFVTGYSFQSHIWYCADQESLIQEAGKQLGELFSHYRDLINQWGRIRPGFTQHLLADQLLKCLLGLKELRGDLSNNETLHQAKLWLDAFQLPYKHLESLRVDSTTERLNVVRTSCCLVYKCDEREVCNDCPRLESNKNGSANTPLIKTLTVA